MKDNLRKTAVLKKISIVNKSYTAKNCTNEFRGTFKFREIHLNTVKTVFKCLQALCLDFPYICGGALRDDTKNGCVADYIFVCNFSREILVSKKTFLQTNEPLKGYIR